MLAKVLVAVLALAAFGFLFIRSVRDTRSQPYTVELDQLRAWSLALEAATSPNAPVLVLRPPPELPMGMFRQVFARAMESLASPAAPGIPVVLKGEFDRALAGHSTPEALLAAARSAGLESSAPDPRCLAHRREREPGVTRQAYFLIFDWPEFERFREQLAAMVDDGAPPRGGFDPAALSPVLLIAASEPGFSRWLTLRADPETDCVAPIAIG